VDPHFESAWSVSAAGILLGYASVAAAFGYVSHGFIIDSAGNRYGPLFGLMFSMWGCGLSALLMSFSTSVLQLTIGAAFLRFCYAAGMPSLLKAIQLTIPFEHHGLAIGVVGFASRTGALSGRSLFGALLGHFSWRNIALMVSFTLLAVGSLVLTVVNCRLSKAHQIATSKTLSGTGKKAEGATLGCVAREPATWLMAVSFAFLCWLMHTDDFMPLIFFGLTGSPNSIPLSGAFPLGSLVGMMANTVAASHGWFRSRQSRDKLYVHIICIAFLSFACLSQLAPPANVVPEPSGAGHIFWVSVMLFIAGFCLAPGYYLLVNIYCMEAGKDDSATLVGIYEFIAFCSKGAADPMLLNMADTCSWKATIGTLSLLALASGILLHVFHCRCEVIRVCGLLAEPGGLERYDHGEDGNGKVSAMEAAKNQDKMHQPVEADAERDAGFVKEYAVLRRKPVGAISE